MKHPLETTETFICLRAKGWSYGRIADQLAISKSTAYDWDRKFAADIAKFRAIEIEAIHERILGDYETEISWLGSELKRVQDVLRGRDYGYENTTALWSYQASLMKRIDRHRAAVTFPEPDLPGSPSMEITQAESLSETPPKGAGEPIRTQPNDIQPGAESSLEPKTQPCETSERIRTEPNDNQPEAANSNEQPVGIPVSDQSPTGPGPEPVPRKKHQPYWLNGVYYANPEFPYHVAHGMISRRGT